MSGLIIKETQSLVKTIDSKIKKVNESMLKLVKSDDQLNQQYKLISTVPGVGDITALYLLIYTGGFSKFSSFKQFACYCGIAPFDFQSGTSIRAKTRVSHLANKKLKSVLTLCTLGLIRAEGEFKTYYLRKKAEGKNSMSVINVLRNKIISRVFAVIKRGTEYVPAEKYLQAA